MFWSEYEKKNTLLSYFFASNLNLIRIERFRFSKFDFIMLIQGHLGPGSPAKSSSEAIFDPIIELPDPQIV